MAKLSHVELIHLMIQLSVMLAFGRIMAEVARKFKQPAVVGEIIAGLILGPTILGTFSPDSFDLLFPKTGASAIVLDGFTKVAVVMLLFIAGLEEDLFPHARLGEEHVSEAHSEEERRLFYVALTRARKKVMLSYAQLRTIYGNQKVNTPSQFISDTCFGCPPGCCTRISGSPTTTSSFDNLR